MTLLNKQKILILGQLFFLLISHEFLDYLSMGRLELTNRE